LVFVLVAISALQASEPNSPIKPVLRVGIHEKPPYALLDAAGNWQGLAIDLWRRVAVRANLDYQFVPMPFEDLLPAVEDGRLDLAVGELEVTANAEQNVDFTQPYLVSSIGAATLYQKSRANWESIASEFFNWTLLQILVGIFVGMLAVSLLIWLLEKDHHVGHFHGGVNGFGSALWFAAVTMTTVGYGDKTPATLAGRLVSFVWMLAGVLLVAGFTAAVTSSATSARVGELVGREEDLHRVPCGVLAGSVGESLLVERGIPSIRFESFEAGFSALANRQIGAFVGDKIPLRFLAKEWASRNPPTRIAIPPMILRDILIGIPIHPSLSQRKAINVAVLQTTASPEWTLVLQRWLGHP